MKLIEKMNHKCTKWTTNEPQMYKISELIEPNILITLWYAIKPQKFEKLSKPEIVWITSDFKALPKNVLA